MYGHQLHRINIINLYSLHSQHTFSVLCVFNGSSGYCPGENGYVQDILIRTELGFGSISYGHNQYIIIVTVITYGYTSGYFIGVILFSTNVTLNKIKFNVGLQ